MGGYRKSRIPFLIAGSKGGQVFISLFFLEGEERSEKSLAWRLEALLLRLGFS